MKNGGNGHTLKLCESVGKFNDGGAIFVKGFTRLISLFCIESVPYVQIGVTAMLTAIAKRDKTIALAGSAKFWSQSLGEIEQRRPRIVLVSARDPFIHDISIHQVKFSLPETRFAILFDRDARDISLSRIFAQGFDGIFYNQWETPQWRRAIHYFDQEGWLLPRALAQRLIKELQQEGGRYLGRAPHALTEKQKQTLALLSSGKTVEEIAIEQKISLNTVKDNLKRLYKRLGVHTRSQASFKIRDEGLLV